MDTLLYNSGCIATIQNWHSVASSTCQFPFLPIDNKDYEEIDLFNPPIDNPFNNDTRYICFDITITDDDVLELTESFLLSVFVLDSLPVQIVPNVSTITILDNESK